MNLYWAEAAMQGFIELNVVDDHDKRRSALRSTPETEMQIPACADQSLIPSGDPKVE